MDNIAPIVELLDRDGALELDIEERTYGEVDEPVSIDWGSLFPGQNVAKGTPDWELVDDPWNSDLPDEIVDEISAAVESERGVLDSPFGPSFPEDVERSAEPIWEVCAWYQPIHYFGHDWGIYIREDCLLKLAVNIARHLRVDPWQAAAGRTSLAKAVIRSAFAAFFLHEHFHHKVESLGLRMHVLFGRSAYLPYKKNVYRPNYLTDDCLEEAMANADSYRRLSTQPYSRLIGKAVLQAALAHLEATFQTDPPGYRMANRYLTKGSFDSGASLLQGQVKEALLKPTQPPGDWLAAKQLLRSYFSVHSNIYTVVPRGKRPFLPSKVIPKTCSSKEMIKLYKSRGYIEAVGGKGSHVKLKKAGAPTMHLPGNRRTLSPGVLNGALKTLGNYTINDIDRLIGGL